MTAPLSARQARALDDARKGLLYRTPSGWRRRGGGLHDARIMRGLIRRGLACRFRTQGGQLAAILTATGLVTADALREARA